MLCLMMFYLIWCLIASLHGFFLRKRGAGKPRKEWLSCFHNRNLSLPFVKRLLGIDFSLLGPLFVYPNCNSKFSFLDNAQHCVAFSLTY